MTRTRMYRISHFVLAGLVACACSDDEPLQGGSAGAGDEGAAGSNAQSGAPGVGGGNGDGGVATGSPGQAGTPGAAGSACEGDAESWAAIIAAPPACETGADCCVVVNSCLAEAQIVHADDFEAAVQAWPYCQDDCTDCIPPVVAVACDNSQCVGTVDPENLDFGDSHCGPTTPLGAEPAQSFNCGG